MQEPLTYDGFVERVVVALEGPWNPAELCEPASRFLGLYDDLEFDSLQVFEMRIIAEALAGIDIPPSDEVTLYTLDDAYSYYLTCTADAASTGQ